VTTAERPRDVSALVHELWKADATAHRLGVTVIAGGPGAATVQLTVAEDHANSHGVCHGGVIFTLADIAMSYASNGHGGQRTATGAGIDYVNAAQVGEVLVAAASEESLRGRAGIYDVRVTAGETLIGTFRGRTLAITES